MRSRRGLGLGCGGGGTEQAGMQGDACRALCEPGGVNGSLPGKGRIGAAAGSVWAGDQADRRRGPQGGTGAGMQDPSGAAGAGQTGLRHRGARSGAVPIGLLRSSPSQGSTDPVPRGGRVARWWGRGVRPAQGPFQRPHEAQRCCRHQRRAAGNGGRAWCGDKAQLHARPRRWALPNSCPAPWPRRWLRSRHPVGAQVPSVPSAGVKRPSCPQAMPGATAGMGAGGCWWSPPYPSHSTVSPGGLGSGWG